MQMSNLGRKKSSQFSSVQSLSSVQLCPTLCNPMNCSTPGPPIITNYQSSLRLLSIKSVMPSSHLILCCPLLLRTPIPPSITVFSNELTLRIRWPQYWSFSFSISPSNEHPRISLQSNTTVQKHQFFGAQLSSQSKSQMTFLHRSTLKC